MRKNKQTPEYSRKYREANKERRRKNAHRYYLANRDRILAYGRAYFAAHKDEVRERRLAYAHKFKNYPKASRPRPNNCECCGRVPAKSVLGLDHCHTENTFRGWLCGDCNRGIGLLGDNLEGLLQAVRYLQ